MQGGSEEEAGARRVRSIFISDIHLGTRACQAESLLDFLRAYECENLFLVGDIIDLWAMQRRGIYWPAAQNTLVQKILRDTDAIVCVSSGAGRVRAVKVREFGEIVAGNEVEAVVVDDAPGFVYYSEELRAIHKWHADPDHGAAGRELARFGEAGFQGDREGLAVYAGPGDSRLLLATDQLVGSSRYRAYRREGRPGAPHDHADVVAVLEGGADATDGLDATAVPLGPSFPLGLVVAMNDRGRNFFFYRPEDVGLVVRR